MRSHDFYPNDKQRCLEYEREAVKTSLRTPLEFAAFAGDIQAIERLIINDVEKNELDRALKLALKWNEKKAAMPLLYKKVNAQATKEVLGYASYKKELFEYINSMNNLNQKALALVSALNPETNLGQFFRIQRGFFQCKKGSGTLKVIEDALKDVSKLAVETENEAVIAICTAANVEQEDVALVSVKP